MAAPEGNKFALGNTGGRPPKFESVEDLEKKIDEYFDSCTIKTDGIGTVISYGDTLTITGLAFHLGFESRQSFYDYEQKQEFSYTIKRARLRVEMFYERRLTGTSPTGAIFALKNFGWKDSQEITHNLPKGIINIDPLDDSADDSPAENRPA